MGVIAELAGMVESLRIAGLPAGCDTSRTVARRSAAPAMSGRAPVECFGLLGGDGHRFGCAACRSASAVLRGVKLEGAVGILAAGPAPGADAQLVLQLLEARAALANGGDDVAVGNPVADANDHALIVMRMIHICKPFVAEGFPRANAPRTHPGPPQEPSCDCR